MRKIIVTALAASLMASSVQMAAAAERHHHARKIVRAPISQQFRNANNWLPRGSAEDSDFLLYHTGN
ncbi:MAG: hypothetical protein QOF22_866 [Bradyrhizobium sp.]|nr:hypothetical protein [Bradyrhizobium sp.]